MTDEQRTWYVRGYFRALVAALRAMDHVGVRRALWMKDRRRRARLAALERARLADAADASSGEAIRVLVDHLGGDVPKGREQVRGKFHAVIALGERVAEDERSRVSGVVEIERRDAVDEMPLHRHEPTIRQAITKTQSENEPGGTSRSDGDPSAISVALPCGDLVRRDVRDQRVSRRRKQKRKS